jgi:multicomponent Na+:H+ antiporter subunit B
MMIGSYPTVVVRVISALLAPFIAMFGLYVIAHGHYGPGGGFAGGVFVAVGAILPRLTLPETVSYRLVPTTVGPIAGGIGMLLFLAIGLAPLALGGGFLDYSLLAFGDIEVARARYLGILVVEIAVGLAVFGAMVLLFDVLTGRAQESRPTSGTRAGTPPRTPRDGSR